MSAKEEVIHDNVCAIRKQIIHLQLEIKFANEYVADNIEQLSSDIRQAFSINIGNMEKEVELLLLKLKFYQKERDAMIDKKVMREYRRFPKTVSMSQLVEIDK